MKKPTKVQQWFLSVAPFLLLTVFQVAAEKGGVPTGRLLEVAAAVLACCIVAVLIAYRWGRPGYFDWAVTAYLAVITAALALWPQPAGRVLARYSVTGIYLCLFAAAFFPPLLGLPPFTVHYARKRAPEALWENPLFMRVNRIMTYAWAGLFALCFLVSLHPSWIARFLGPMALLLGLGGPFNRRFPDYYLRRLGLPPLSGQERRAAQGAPAPHRGPKSGPLPATAREAIESMPGAFDAGAAEGLRAVIGFVVSGAETFHACLRIENNTCTFETRSSRKPDLLIRTPADAWLAIARGDMDPQNGFATKAYTAEGNLGLLLRMGRIFGGNPAPGPAAGPPVAPDAVRSPGNSPSLTSAHPGIGNCA